MNDMTSNSRTISEFAGQVAFVTGAARGIGLAVARMLAEGGATVAMADRDEQQLAASAQALREAGARLLVLHLDLRDGAAIDAAVERCETELGPIDILVSVAGVLHLGNLLDMDDADWESSFAVNSTAVFRLCRAVGLRMRARRNGNIVAVCSNAARTPRLGMGAYAASKAATTHFIRNLALELAPYRIRCNTVSPGSTDTDMQRALWSSPDDSEKIIQGEPERYRLGIPLGRIADPEDVAAAVCFLASPRSRQITMHDLCVDGGATLGA